MDQKSTATVSTLKFCEKLVNQGLTANYFCMDKTYFNMCNEDIHFIPCFLILVQQQELELFQLAQGLG